MGTNRNFFQKVLDIIRILVYNPLGTICNMNEKYLAILEQKCGRKSAHKSDPAIMEIHIKNTNGEIVSRCVMQWIVKTYGTWNTRCLAGYWAMIRTDDKYHKLNICSYMNSYQGFEMLEKLWKSDTWEPLEFYA